MLFLEAHCRTCLLPNLAAQNFPLAYVVSVSPNAYLHESSRQCGVRQASVQLCFMILEVFLATLLTSVARKLAFLRINIFYGFPQKHTIGQLHSYLAYAHRLGTFINTTTRHSSISMIQYSRSLALNFLHPLILGTCVHRASLRVILQFLFATTALVEALEVDSEDEEVGEPL